MRHHPGIPAATILLLALAILPVAARGEPATLFRDVRIFNGVDRELRPGHVLVAGGVIERISSAPIEPPAGARVIEGRGRLLTPGFIDLHAHLTLQMPRDRL